MSSPEILSPVSTSCIGNSTSRGSQIALADSSSPSPQSFDKAKRAEIQSMLKTRPNEYIIIENTGKHTSNCWTLFEFPAINNINGDAGRINGFVSCRKCFGIYSFISNSTRFLNQYDCEGSKERNKRLASNGTLLSRRCLTTFFSGQPPILKTSEILKIKDLQAEWKCICIGARHDCIDVVAAHVFKLAGQHRVQIGEELVEPLASDAVAFCPYLRSDSIHQIFDLGIAAALVNDEFEYRSYDLCCSPFEEDDKTAARVVVALGKVLERFNINDLSLLKFVMDRESTDENATDSRDLFSCNALHDDISKTKVKYLPHSAREVLKVLNSCKNLVKYAKLNGLSEDIQSAGDVSLCQSSKIRWLSIMKLLESIDRSFKETKKILLEKKKLLVINRLIIEHPVYLLRPFKHIIVIAQKGKDPSLYLVLICVMASRKTLSSFEDLIDFNKENDAHDNVSATKKESDDDQDDTEAEQSDGIRFFRLRLLELLKNMFVLEPIHYVAAFLHPRYRYLHRCSNDQINSCKSHIRREFKQIADREKIKRLFSIREKDPASQREVREEPPPKKRKELAMNMKAGTTATNATNLMIRKKSTSICQCIPIPS
ncbi:unnamed protein product [Adineta ricciae]|uniref:Uncharacterized protein n=1 Tax=Adineta ricciae TaxID=249248 RepID=A0A815WYL0_ADIRI|nr:unnamed protein product [Adineta ricciae]CAF1547892.1 unnamed protein product [Adineta ricciae]